MTFGQKISNVNPFSVLKEQKIKNLKSNGLVIKIKAKNNFHSEKPFQWYLIVIVKPKGYMKAINLLT